MEVPYSLLRAKKEDKEKGNFARVGVTDMKYLIDNQADISITRMHLICFALENVFPKVPSIIVNIFLYANSIREGGWVVRKNLCSR